MDDLDIMEPWYGVRTVYEVPFESDTAAHVYEERVVVFRAPDFDAAIALAESEAASFCEVTGSRYLGYLDCFHIADDAIGHGTEVYSLMRDSDLEDASYVKRFFGTGLERSADIPE